MERPARPSAFGSAESAHEIDDQANQQNQTQPAAADNGTAQVKSAATKQQQENNDEE